MIYFYIVVIAIILISSYIFSKSNDRKTIAYSGLIAIAGSILIYLSFFSFSL